MIALALFSGGLDSTLAIRTILNQGIEVIALHFVMPLSRFDTEKEELMHKKINELGAQLKIIHLEEDFVEILKNPKFGYGKNMNPCMDCKILMLKHARNLMKELGASFVITGEVLAQRPKSQHKDSLWIIEKEAGLTGLLLRPLSAKLLKPTIPESKGWIKRDDLFDFNGRSRKPQFKLAQQFGIEEFAWPAGGCLLTISSFCTRVKDLIEHDECTSENLRLLQIGRHLRLAPGFKLIVGRNEKENEKLIYFTHEKDIVIEPKDMPGPTGLGKGSVNTDIKLLSSRIIAHYTNSAAKIVNVVIKSSQGKTESLPIEPIEEKKLHRLII